MNPTVSIVVYFLFIFGVIYFLMIRPQKNRAKLRQTMLNSIRVKDKVITVGGIYGKVTKVKDNSVLILVADKVEIEVTKAGIASIENQEVAEKEKKNDSIKLVKEEKVEAEETVKSAE